MKWNKMESDPVSDIRRMRGILRIKIGYQKPNPIVRKCECRQIDKVTDVRCCSKCGSRNFELILLPKK